MSSGLAAVREAINAGKSRSSSGGGGQFGDRLDYLYWKAEDRKIVRFLTDDILVKPFASNVLTNTGQTMDFLIDPDDNLLEKYGAQSKAFNGEVGPLRIRELGVGLAVLREERPIPGTNKTEIVDYTYDKKIGDQTFKARHFGIVKQSLSNFWNSLVFGPGEVYKTIVDRDYMVVRIGGDKDTTYSFIPLDPIDGLREPEEVQARYGYGKERKADDPNRFLICPQTLPEWAEYYGGEERVEHWLGGLQKPAQAQQQPSLSSGGDEAQASGSFADLRSRLMPNVSSLGTSNLNSDEPPPF